MFTLKLPFQTPQDLLEFLPIQLPPDQVELASLSRKEQAEKQKAQMGKKYLLAKPVVRKT